jgi:hypothetical protein
VSKKHSVNKLSAECQKLNTRQKASSSSVIFYRGFFRGTRQRASLRSARKKYSAKYLVLDKEPNFDSKDSMNSWSSSSSYYFSLLGKLLLPFIFSCSLHVKGNASKRYHPRLEPSRGQHMPTFAVLGHRTTFLPKSEIKISKNSTDIDHSPKTGFIPVNVNSGMFGNSISQHHSL